MQSSVNLPDDKIRQIDEIIGARCKPYHIVGDRGERVDTGCIAWPAIRSGTTPTWMVPQQHIYVPGHGQMQDEVAAMLESLLRDPPPHIKALLDSLGPLTPTQIEDMQQYVWERILSLGAPDEDIETTPAEADQVLAQVREVLRGYPVIAYKGELVWADVTATAYEHLVVAPTIDQFDILRIERTNAANYGMLTEELIAKLKVLDTKYEIEITGASFSAVEFVLKQIPTGENARELGQWLLEFCPDLFEAPTSFPAGRVALWWD